jgi:hypothetical protein
MAAQFVASRVVLSSTELDFRKAFDSVNRERIYESMKQMEIPDKLN